MCVWLSLKIYECVCVVWFCILYVISPVFDVCIGFADEVLFTIIVVEIVYVCLLCFVCVYRLCYDCLYIYIYIVLIVFSVFYVFYKKKHVLFDGFVMIVVSVSNLFIWCVVSLCGDCWYHCCSCVVLNAYIYICIVVFMFCFVFLFVLFV